MWFDSWTDIGRILLVGASTYVVLIVVLRLSGKRTLSQLNAFDFIVTVALGSTLSSILLDSTISWSEGLTALGLLAALQFLVAWAASRRPWVRGLLTARPVLLFSDGSMHHDALRRQRLTESAVMQAIRGSGRGDLSLVGAVVLETNGTFSVIPGSDCGDRSALSGVEGE
ncbi:DUF421 domain-containing protein [Cryobacterium tepidiphilum]|uniref:DUF421 domain-containing protein n=1 Tax=Cryobacterium tepidiphilum TaxID=2486026 RepID=A0A3M8LBP8_9MICO|nr:YetF domain-containing protein [Cryobacterium tepidiphilum]RNE62202.1 DUF421 domain-containing protein [Cryobacterium tepidiphilum]